MEKQAGLDRVDEASVLGMFCPIDLSWLEDLTVHEPAFALTRALAA